MPSKTNCQDCLEQYTITPGSYGKFCSLSCAAKTQNAQRKRNSLLAYNANPNKCTQCLAAITSSFNKRLSEVKRKKFCSRSCAAIFNNLHAAPDRQRGPLPGLQKELNRDSVLNTTRDSKTVRKVINCPVCGTVKEYRTRCPNYEICKRRQAFNGFQKYFGLDLKYIGTYKILDEIRKIQLELQTQYNNGLSTTDLCKKYKHSDSRNFGKLLSSLGIEIRSLSDAQINSLKQGKGQQKEPFHCQYKQGFHTTWNNKKVFLRSSYEFHYAIMLDEKQIDYEVENFRISYWDSEKQKERIAIPDFYLPASNMIVEIKSNYSLNVRQMKDKCKAYKTLGYQFKLILEKKDVNLNNLVP